MNTAAIVFGALACLASAWTAVCALWLVLALHRREDAGSVACHAWCTAGMALTAAASAAAWALMGAPVP